MFVEFFGGNYFLAWCALWLLWGVVALTALVFQLVQVFYIRTLRAVQVLFRGWPPENLDANGNFRVRAGDDDIYHEAEQDIPKSIDGVRK